MADTILGGKLTVYYSDDNRRQQIRWTGTTAKSDFQKQIDVFDAIEDLFTGPTQHDEGLIYSGETPGEYTIGKIDAGEIDPWFVDLRTMEHIIGDFANFTGCALKTSGWTRATGTNTGIVVVPATSGHDIDDTDIGDGVTNGSDQGTLLDVVITGGATDYLFIRPLDNTATHDWDTGSGTINCDSSAHAATQSAVAHTGEMVWGNAFTQGGIQLDTHVYLYQEGVKITGSDQTDNDFWEDGQIDRPIPITDYQTAAFPLIDAGFLTVKANQYSTGYTYAIIRMNSASGGNVSAPLGSGVDAGNQTGYKSIDHTTAAGNWAVGDEMTGDVSTARGIITQIDNPGASQTVHYYLVGDPLTDFNGSEACSNADDTGTCASSSAVSQQGPDLTTWFDGNAKPTYAFANTQVDIADTGTPQEWTITIDMLSCLLAEMYEYNKFAQRRGSTLDHDGLNGEEWIGLDYAINYATITGTVGEGSVVTGQTSGATGTVVSNPATEPNVAILRNTRGTFVDGEDISLTPASHEFDGSGLTVEAITPVAAASFGTLAGGLFFGTRGVLLANYTAGEENSFTLIDSAGVTRQRPTAITVTASSLLVNDWCSSWRLTAAAGPIDKAEYTATGGESTNGTTIVVDGNIAADVPNKDNGGRIVIRDADDANQKYVLRFASFVATGGTITLATTGGTAEGGTTTTVLNDTGVFIAANVQVGDLIWNITRSLYAYVISRDDDDNVTLDRAIAGQTTGDTFTINALPIAITAGDDVYFAIMHQFVASGTTVSVSMQYVGDIETRGRVRNTLDAAIKIKGFTTEYTIGTGGGAFSATRIENTVYGS